MKMAKREMKNLRELCDKGYSATARAVVVKRHGMRWALKRFTRRAWVREGYLEDFLWILENGNTNAKYYAIDNAWRNGFCYTWKEVAK